VSAFSKPPSDGDSAPLTTQPNVDMHADAVIPEAVHPDTTLAQAAHYQDAISGALVPPIVQSTTYARGANYALPQGKIYARDDNPTFEPAEQVIAALEAPAGAAARATKGLLFSSGMAAACSWFALASEGAHIVAPTNMYYALKRWLGSGLARPRTEISFVDMCNLQAVAKAIRPGHTQLVWVESPANPTLDVTDIAAVAKLTRGAGALMCVDSTVATPMLTRPLDLGAHWVMHSATKYLNGHGDALIGVLVAAASEPTLPQIARHRRETGNIPGPHDAALLLRGLRTLHLRVARASATALALCTELESHPAIAKVYYPGLPSFAGHAVANKQMHGGYGGLFSIELRGGQVAALQVCAKLKHFARATSLGSTESLVEHRASVEGSTSDVSPGLLRFSVGLEDQADLARDLAQALAAVA
jgi:cystathionine gamma-synthase